MRKQNYIQIFELLAAVMSKYEKDTEKWTGFLNELGKFLKTNIEDDLVTEIYTQFASRAPSGNIIDSDKLFVTYSDLDLIYTNLEILHLRERLLFYTCIVSWFRKFNFSLSDDQLLKRILDLQDEHIESINSFLSDRETEETIGRNVIFFLRPNKSESDDLEGKWIESNRPRELDSLDQFEFENLKETLKILFCDDLKLFFICTQNCKLPLRKKDQLDLCGWQIIGPGESIDQDTGFRIDYYTLKKRFLHERYASPVHLNVRELTYHYPNGKGVQSIGFDAVQGTIIGLIGREGAGKSTLLKLIAGELTANKGTVVVNGYDLQKELYNLKGLLGFVPEEDLLFDELSVYNNLLSAARFYHSKAGESEIRQKTLDLLRELDLYNYKDVIVGSLTEKRLQPGQRRLLNIALEIIRDPMVLIVDNGMTSLSPIESDNVIEILSKYAFKGKIVITSIAQTSGKTLDYFDELIILDEGGLPVYSGKSTEVYDYFYDLYRINLIDQEPQQGADKLLDLISSSKKSSRSFGERYYSPWELNAFYLEKTRTKKLASDHRRILPSYFIHPPTLDRQYVLFGIRNFKTKLSRSKELLFTLVSSPVLALILSLILRKTDSYGYNFYSNDNIPVFFFISTLVAIFVGLVQSSNEILNENRIYLKQEYHNLSRFSYINSKITYLFIIGLLQSFLFVLIGSAILQIRGMFLLYWLVIFSSMSFGLLMGLLLSTIHKSLFNLLTKSLPIIMVLEIIYGGGFINMNSVGFSQKSYTPIVADLMVSRWAYESLMVYQFKNNKYESNFYETDRRISNTRFNAVTLVPLLKSNLNYCETNFESHPDSVGILLNSIRVCLERLRQYNDIFPYENIDKLTSEAFNKEVSLDLREYLEYLNLQFYSQLETATKRLKLISDSLNNSDPVVNTTWLKNRYYNEAISSLVKNAKSENTFQYAAGMIIRLTDPIFQHPVSCFFGFSTLSGIIFCGEKI